MTCPDPLCPGENSCRLHVEMFMKGLLRKGFCTQRNRVFLPSWSHHGEERQINSLTCNRHNTLRVMVTVSVDRECTWTAGDQDRLHPGAGPPPSSFQMVRGKSRDVPFIHCVSNILSLCHVTLFSSSIPYYLR